MSAGCRIIFIHKMFTFAIYDAFAEISSNVKCIIEFLLDFNQIKFDIRGGYENSTKANVCTGTLDVVERD